MRKFFQSGEPFVWLTGGSLAFCLLIVGFLMYLIASKALVYFWPSDVARIEMRDGNVTLGEIVEREQIPVADTDGKKIVHRIKVKRGNRDVYGQDFIWLDEEEIKEISYPEDIVTVERREWGNFYGEWKGIAEGGEIRETGWNDLQKDIDAAFALHERVQEIARIDIGKLNKKIEDVAIELRVLEDGGVTTGAKVEALESKKRELEHESQAVQGELAKMRTSITSAMAMVTVDGRDRELPMMGVVHAYRPNAMGFVGKAGFYVMKFWEFIFHEPRESNTEGGVFPAIFGTVVMVFIMTLIVTPFGILAAFYLREYARQGVMVSIVRIAVNNLAGVPSIVFGVFGLGFFIYAVGSGIDHTFFADRLPTPTFGTGGVLWASLTLALLTVPVVIVATEEGLAGIPTGIREGSLALGATKFETTWRVVLPAVAPSMLTGLILAIARAAGEVAPLMLTGVVKLAPSLPINGIFPYVHLDQKFMHLGFHIYDVGFQSPNVDAARPMVYAASFLLLIIVVVLNLAAIQMRNYLRKRYALSAV